MERRDPDPSGRLEAKAWQAIRRALGKLVSRVGVRRVEDAERMITAGVRRFPLVLPPAMLSPVDAWKPFVSVCRAAVPQAATGLRESDLLPAVTLVRGDYAPEMLGLQAMPLASAGSVGMVSASLDWPVDVIRLPEAFLRLPSSPVQVGTVPLLTLPKTTSLRAWKVPLPPVKPLRLPRAAEPRVRWGGDSVLRRMPLTRRGRGPSGAAQMAGDFSAERRRLAETAHLEMDEIMLLGVYPNVPILAVERIMVEDEGRQLRLWIKPEVLRGRSAAHRITLLVGRQTSTGKMLQAAL